MGQSETIPPGNSRAGTALHSCPGQPPAAAAARRGAGLHRSPLSHQPGRHPAPLRPLSRPRWWGAGVAGWCAALAAGGHPARCQSVSAAPAGQVITLSLSRVCTARPGYVVSTSYSSLLHREVQSHGDSSLALLFVTAKSDD